MIKPNYFIIGAPKSATTALQRYLSEHPSIYMAGPEEPNFYSTDLKNQQNVSTEEEYLDKFFSDAKEHHIAVGEKSTWYLSSENAIENINESYPEAKYIAILRNPVDLASSLHSELVYTEQEDITDFRQAWKAQEDRKKGLRIPGTLKMDIKMLYYGDICKLGQQVKRVLDVIPSERVMFILYDDFKNDTQSVYKLVLSFLGVPDDLRQDFNKVNQNRVIRSRFLDRVLTPNNKHLVAAVIKLKKTLGLKRLGVGGFLTGIKNKYNSKKIERAPMSPDIKQELNEYFREDVRLLSRLINRDLEHWIE